MMQKMSEKSLMIHSESSIVNLYAFVLVIYTVLTVCIKQHFWEICGLKQRDVYTRKQHIEQQQSSTSEYY